MSFAKYYIVENLQSFEITIKDVENFLDRPSRYQSEERKRL